MSTTPASWTQPGHSTAHSRPKAKTARKPRLPLVVSVHVKIRRHFANFSDQSKTIGQEGIIRRLRYAGFVDTRYKSRTKIFTNFQNSRQVHLPVHSSGRSEEFSNFYTSIPKTRLTKLGHPATCYSDAVSCLCILAGPRAFCFARLVHSCELASRIFPRRLFSALLLSDSTNSRSRSLIR